MEATHLALASRSALLVLLFDMVRRRLVHGESERCLLGSVAARPWYHRLPFAAEYGDLGMEMVALLDHSHVATVL